MCITLGNPLTPKTLAEAPEYLFSPIDKKTVSPDYRGGPITTRQYIELPWKQQMIVDMYCEKLEEARKLGKS